LQTLSTRSTQALRAAIAKPLRHCKTVRTKDGKVPQIKIDARLNEVDAEGQFKHLYQFLKNAMPRLHS